MHIREAGPDDDGAIRDLIRAAFGLPEGPEVAGLVADLVRDVSARPLWSLVADVGGVPVGHVLFSRVRFDPPDVVAAAAILAPLAVHPDAQGRGVGGRLVGEGFQRLARAGVGWVFVLGDPAYYSRFGFVPAAGRGFRAPHPIPLRYADAWMVRELGVEGAQGSTPAAADGGGERLVRCADSLMHPRYWAIVP